MSKPRRTRIRLLAAERSELERRVAARTASQQDAYRAQIILGVADGPQAFVGSRALVLEVGTRPHELEVELRRAPRGPRALAQARPQRGGENAGADHHAEC